MTTKRRTGFADTTRPNHSSSGDTMAFEALLDCAAECVPAFPALPLASPGSGPAALFVEQPEPSTASTKATQTHRMKSVNEFDRETSTGKPEAYFLRWRAWSLIFFHRLSQSAQLCVQSSPENSLRAFDSSSSVAFNSRWAFF